MSELPLIDPGELWAADLTPQVPAVLQQPAQVHPEFTGKACCQAAVEALPDAKFCPGCGSQIQAAGPQDWTCSGGHQNEAVFQYCPQCGDGRPDRRPPVAGAGALVEMAARPKPYEELTPAERAERERQHLAAVAAGNRDPGLVAYDQPRSSDTQLIHFLEDGLTFAGQVWFRGQEIELDRGSLRWQQAQPWINLDDFAQVRRFGKVMFRKGPWPGVRYVDALREGGYQQLGPLREGGEEIHGPSVEQLLQAEARERARGRGVPRPQVR